MQYLDIPVPHILHFVCFCSTAGYLQMKKFIALSVACSGNIAKAFIIIVKNNYTQLV